MPITTEFDGRPVRAVIDCLAFKHNIKIAEQLAPNAKVLVVIKADAYGHGLLEMAHSAGDDATLAVATAEEAKRLIDGGVKNTIWVLEGPFSEACLALSVKHSIVWVLHSFWQFDLLKKYQAAAKIVVCLKFDTGMHRLGFLENEVCEAVSELGRLPRLELKACMSHFAGSDWPDSELVYQQIQRFDALIKANNLGDISQSLSNSGGVLFYDQAHRDWIRPGIMLYGAMPHENQRAQDCDLQPVMRFESAVMSLKSIQKGESVGYGSTWTAEKASVIAIVAVGYGDGYPRHAPNGTPAVVSGQIASLAGRVSMDMLAIDVTGLEGVSIGSPVELWGKYVSVDQVAALSGTISYELLTGVTSRVPRVYIS
jgi:alanine racemase